MIESKIKKKKNTLATKSAVIFAGKFIIVKISI
jgi:hypothetical protein